MIFDLSPCANCGHASAIHQVGSVCGAAHCYCRGFVIGSESSEGVDERSSPGSRSDASGATTRFAPAPSDSSVKNAA